MKIIKNTITTKKERVLLSDVLPFEIPVTFSNRYYYMFLVENDININNNIISWGNPDRKFNTIIKLIFGLSDKEVKRETNSEMRIDSKALKTIPFSYKISHKEAEYRELTVVHPLNQLSIVEFYEKYKNLILYYCSISDYSLRKPYSIARFSYYKDKTHFKHLSHDHEHKTAEEFDKEYESLKTYFSYREIGNIYKFYESYKYHRCEKKYNYLCKLDVSKCFDSIYSHSISWSLLNKEVVKENIDGSMRTFGGNFDRLMQNLNHNETNGIVIGPEFSRIFAEIILQRIDKDVSKALKDSLPECYHKRDYDIYRYVDDYFVFYNDEKVKDVIIKEYTLKLKDYKLYLNGEKTVVFPKPIITGITKAKLKITDLLDKQLSFNVSADKTEGHENVYAFYVSSNKMITRFKAIIDDAGISYKDILNYTMACIDRKVQKLIKIYSNIDDKIKYERKVAAVLSEILDFSFFLYTVSPRVNTTIKLSLILSKSIKFTKIKGNFNYDNKHLIFKKIYDDIFLVLRKYQSAEHVQVETLYLLIALKSLGRDYRIDEGTLSNNFGMNLDSNTCDNQLNYFSIVVLLFYIENKKRYEKIKRTLKKHVIEKFNSILDENRGKNTELTFLLLDLISCPYLDRKFKNRLFSIYDINNGHTRSFIINSNKYWFTKWTDFDLGKELEAKKSHDVY